jgi:DNA polymerase III epsilon subunit-like protein
MILPFRLVCIDIETTDVSSKLGSIIQLSAVVVDNNFEPIRTREFNEYIKPLDSYRSCKAMEVNQISEETLKTALTLHEALILFESFCEKENILASWGAYFDIPFLKAQYEKINKKWPFSHRTFDLKTVAIWELAKRDIQMTGGVKKILNALNKEFVGIQHDSLDDIKNAVEILRYLKLNDNKRSIYQNT